MTQPAPPSRLHRLCDRLHRDLITDRRGSVSVEAAIVMPILILALLAMFVFFDAFRSNKANLTATYTISDLISRKVSPVTPAEIDDMRRLFIYLARARYRTDLRVSSIYYDVIEQRYKVIWSYAAGGETPLNDATLNAINERLPQIPRGDTALLVEGTLNYRPPMSAWIRPMTMSHFVVTRPRFAPQVAYRPPGGGVVELTPCQQNLVTCGW